MSNCFFAGILLFFGIFIAPIVRSQDVMRSPNVPRVALTPALSVHWNNETGTIEEDDLYDTLKHAVKDRIVLRSLIGAVNDTTPLPYTGCAKKNNYRVGDMALDHLHPIQIMRDLGIQCDVYAGDCPYCGFLFDEIEYHRRGVTASLLHAFGFKTGRKSH